MRTIAHRGVGGGGVGLKVAYVRKKTIFGPQNLKTIFFCTKEAITLPFIIMYRKV